MGRQKPATKYDVQATQSEEPERVAGNGTARTTASGIHWRAPAIMFGSLIAGVAIAVGHHLFYQRFDHQPVESISQQNWIIRGGTAFAFLVKMSLAIATSAAYVQQFWATLGKKSVRISRVDALFTALKDMTVFGDVRLWLGNPILTALAIVTWALPIAAIITPGTMTVENSLSLTKRVTHPPQLDFTSGKFAIVDTTIDIWSGPSTSVVRLATASAAQQEILQLRGPATNSSYEFDYLGPAIQCNLVDRSKLAGFNATLASAYVQYGPNLTQLQSDPVHILAYTAWAPSNQFPNISTPALNGTTSAYDESSSDGARLYLFFANYKIPNRMVFLDCVLQNATQTVSFNFTDNDQTVKLESIRYLNPVPFSGDTVEVSSSTVAYFSVMAVFSQILAGAVIITIGDGGVETAAIYETTLVQITALQQFLDLLDVNGATEGVIDPLTVKHTVEELFQNITLSFLSSSQFWLNKTAAQGVLTTIKTAQNLYIYRPQDLYIAYGVSIACAFVCVGFGCGALVRNGLSYTNDFSTILRTTQRRELDALVATSDTAGGDPLPEHLARAVVRYDAGAPGADGVVQGFRPQQGGAEVEIEKAKNEHLVRGEGQRLIEHDSGIQDPANSLALPGGPAAEREAPGGQGSSRGGWTEHLPPSSRDETSQQRIPRKPVPGIGQDPWR